MIESRDVLKHLRLTTNTMAPFTAVYQHLKRCYTAHPNADRFKELSQIFPNVKELFVTEIVNGPVEFNDPEANTAVSG